MSVPKTMQSSQDPGAVAALKNLKDKVQSGLQKYRGGHANIQPQRGPNINDFSRLARRICGKSIGVVLGGGGARGISHLVSAIRSLLSALPCLQAIGCHSSDGGVWYPDRPHWRYVRRVSIFQSYPDCIFSGTSIGAFVGGLYAREGDIISSAGRAKQFSSRMSNIWRMLSDVTYPIVAYTTVSLACFFLARDLILTLYMQGHEFNRSIYKVGYTIIPPSHVC